MGKGLFVCGCRNAGWMLVVALASCLPQIVSMFGWGMGAGGEVWLVSLVGGLCAGFQEPMAYVRWNDCKYTVE